MSNSPGLLAQACRAALARPLRATLTVATLALPSPAWPCAPTPQAAAEAWARATAACDFVAAWSLLHPADREATDIGLWTRERADTAIDALDCYGHVQAVSIEQDGTSILGRIVRSIPVAVLEFQRLRDSLHFAPLLARDELEIGVERTRARITANGPGSLRATLANSARLRQDRDGGNWCVYLNLAAREQSRADERARVRREDERRADARRRGEAALDLVRMEGVRRTEQPMRGVVVVGEAVNGSPETLRRLVVLVEFLDQAGNAVTERRHTAFPASPYGMPNDRPLRPGHRQPWSYPAHNVTAAWAGGVRARAVEAEIDPDVPPAAAAPPTPPVASPAPVRPPTTPPRPAATSERRATQGSAAPPQPVAAAAAPPGDLPPVSTPPSTAHSEDRAGAVLSTLDRLRQQQAQAGRPNSPAGQPQPAGGTPSASDALTEGERRAVGERIAQCWRVDQGLMGMTDLRVSLLARVDQGGTIRDVRPGPGGVPSDPRTRTLYEQGRRALLDPACSPLPVPRARLQAINEIQFTFTPRGFVR